MNPLVAWALTVVEGYLLGTVLMAPLVARLLRVPDPRSVGSGNPGTANMAASAGPRAGILTLAGDVLKTVAAVLVGRALLPQAPWASVALVAGTAATVGHCFPAWHRFKGGKGVACLCATIVMAEPGWALLSLACGLVALLISKYLCVAGVVVPTAFLVCLLATGQGPVPVLCASAQVLIAFWAHGPFLMGIRNGTTPQNDLLAALRR